MLPAMFLVGPSLASGCRRLTAVAILFPPPIVLFGLLAFPNLFPVNRNLGRSLHTNLDLASAELHDGDHHVIAN